MSCFTLYVGTCHVLGQAMLSLVRHVAICSLLNRKEKCSYITKLKEMLNLWNHVFSYCIFIAEILLIKHKYKTHVIDKFWYKYYYLSCINFQFFTPSNFLPHASLSFILIRSNPSTPPYPQLPRKVLHQSLFCPW